MTLTKYKTSELGVKLIQYYEGLNKVLPDGRIGSYLCPAKVWTIGWGSTIYPNGQKVGSKDIITKERAKEVFLWHLSLFERDVNSLVKNNISQCQFDALVSFAYNVGSDIDVDLIAEGLGDSTLLKKVNNNPNDLTIEQEFLRWNKAGGKVLNGLTKRRRTEATLYFKNELIF